MRPLTLALGTMPLSLLGPAAAAQEFLSSTPTSTTTSRTGPLIRPRRSWTSWTKPACAEPWCPARRRRAQSAFASRPPPHRSSPQAVPDAFRRGKLDDGRVARALCGGAAETGNL